MTDQQKYPLAWPAGQPRTRERTDARFGKKSHPSGDGSFQNRSQLKSLTISEAMHRLRLEVDRMGVDFYDDCIVSSNLVLNLDGMPRSSQSEPKDPGVAVYWVTANGPRVMAIDLYERVADNIAAVARTLEYMRGIERHGGKHIQERAFTGFTALPPPDDCWKILGIKKPPDHHRGIDIIRQAFRTRAMIEQNGGDMARLIKARDEALKQMVK